MDPALSFEVPRTLRLGDRLLDLRTPRVMGVLNVTPDSFYAGSRLGGVDDVLRSAEAMCAAGATFLDVGGYSTRPGADDVPPDEERARVVPVVEALARRFPDAYVSVDTFRAEVAAAAAAAGATLVNDASGGADPAMFATCARLDVAYVLMHTRGTPRTMQGLTDYDDLAGEVIGFLQRKLYLLREHGVGDVLVDPGFGFAKTRPQNFELLARLEEFQVLGCPLLVGVSRKSMIWKTLGVRPDEALNGTTVLNTLALRSGANVLRTHDVKEASEAITLLSQLPQ
ncbi:MAG: dihydropteroate synthase [Catalinimonas sp.]